MGWDGWDWDTIVHNHFLAEFKGVNFPQELNVDFHPSEVDFILAKVDDSESYNALVSTYFESFIKRCTRIFWIPCIRILEI